MSKEIVILESKLEIKDVEMAKVIIENDDLKKRIDKFIETEESLRSEIDQLSDEVQELEMELSSLKSEKIYLDEVYVLEGLEEMKKKYTNNEIVDIFKTYLNK